MFGTTAIWKSFRISDRGEKYGTGTYQSTNHTALGELATVCFYPVIEGKIRCQLTNPIAVGELATIFFYPVLREKKYGVNQLSTQRLASWLPYSFIQFYISITQSEN